MIPTWHADLGLPDREYYLNGAEQLGWLTTMWER
jgi:hypothetical protein